MGLLVGEERRHLIAGQLRDALVATMKPGRPATLLAIGTSWSSHITGGGPGRRRATTDSISTCLRWIRRRLHVCRTTAGTVRTVPTTSIVAATTARTASSDRTTDTAPARTPRPPPTSSVRCMSVATRPGYTLVTRTPLASSSARTASAMPHAGTMHQYVEVGDLGHGLPKPVGVDEVHRPGLRSG